MPRVARKSVITLRPLPVVPGRPAFSAPSVSSNCRAMVLLENLFTSRMISASDSDSCEWSSFAPGGTTPIRQPPSSFPPLSSQKALNVPNAYSGARMTARVKLIVPQPDA